MGNAFFSVAISRWFDRYAKCRDVSRGGGGGGKGPLKRMSSLVRLRRKTFSAVKRPSHDSLSHQRNGVGGVRIPKLQLVTSQRCRK